MESYIFESSSRKFQPWKFSYDEREVQETFFSDSRFVLPASRIGSVKHDDNDCIEINEDEEEQLLQTTNEETSLNEGLLAHRHQHQLIISSSPLLCVPSQSQISAMYQSAAAPQLK